MRTYRYRTVATFFIVGISVCLSQSVSAAGQATVNSLNAQIAANPEVLDYLIQDVCVDASDRPIVGDPATCSPRRNVRVGEKVPYIVTDMDTVNGNTRYQALFSYPVPGTDDQLKVLTSKMMTNAARPVINSGFTFGFDVTRDGFDLLDTSGSYISAIRTSDGGCYDQKISQDANNRRNGWILFPTSGVNTGSLINHNILINRINVSPAVPSNCPLVSQATNNEAQDIWNPPVATTFHSGKNMQSVQTYHVAHWNLSQQNNAIEKFYFTKQYGFTRWEAWIPLSRCIAESGASSPRCNPTHAQNILKGRCDPNTGTTSWGNQTWVRVDCRDTTHYLQLTTPQLPVTSVMAQNNGLVDINSQSVFDAYELVLAGNQNFSHVVGNANGNTWEAAQGVTGHMTYGPYTTALPAKNLTAYFKLVTGAVGGTTPVFNIDIYDATSNQILATRYMTRADFSTANVEQSVPLAFNMTGRAGHAIEFRVWTYGSNYVRVNKVVIQPTP